MLTRKLLCVAVSAALAAIALPCAAGSIVDNRAVEVVGAGAGSDPLIAVEANRGAIINRLIAEHGPVLVHAGVSADAFRDALASLRSDQLLVASLVNSVAEITAIVSDAPANGSALHRFIALTPGEVTSMHDVPAAPAYLVRDGEQLSIVRANELRSGMQLVGYFAPTMSTVVVSETAAREITPKDGSGSGANSWIGYVAGSNLATGTGSAVAAGTFNLASGQGAFVGAGTANQANGISSLVIGGFDNRAVAIDSLVGAGAGNRATGARSVVVGGGYNLASGQWSFIGGGGRNGTDSVPAGTSILDNIAAGDFSVIGGGQGNHTSGIASIVGGGSSNIASGVNATVAGGQTNVASGNNSSVAGGVFNLAAGDYSFVSGRQAKNSAAHTGVFMFADSNTVDFGSATANEFAVRATGGVRFVTAIDGGGNPTRTVAISSGGNVLFGNTTRQMLNLYNTDYGIGVQPSTSYSRIENNGDDGAGGWSWYKGGAHDNGINSPGAGGVELMRLARNGNLAIAGTVISSSDVNGKTAFTPVDAKALLARVANLPITSWQYRDDADHARHIGPMAQDFAAAFGVGTDDRHISMVDGDGVALAAIQGLNAKVEEQQREIADLRDRVSTAESVGAELAAVKAALAELQRSRVTVAAQ